MKSAKNEKWGFLRETSDIAKNSGIEKHTGLHRTGLDEYLSAIFPETRDWIHNKTIGKSIGELKIRTRPDYRSESLKTIVEFDGIQHYQKPDVILNDVKNSENYMHLGYKVVRIPYFIQLTNSAIYTLFGVKVNFEMFNPIYPSLDDSSGSPAYLCHAGVQRMAKDFLRFPDQYKTNLDNLKKINNDFLTGASILELEYNKLIT